MLESGIIGIGDASICFVPMRAYLPLAPVLAATLFYQVSAKSEQALRPEIDRESVVKSYEEDDSNPCTRRHDYSATELTQKNKDIKAILSKGALGESDLIRVSSLSRRIGDCKASLEYANKAVSLNELSSRAYDNRAYIYSLLGNNTLALLDLKRSLLLNPRSGKTYARRCQILLQVNDKEAAIKDCNKAIDIDPQNAQYYSLRGMLRLNMGDPRGGLKDYDQAITIAPNDYSLYQNRGSIKLMSQDYLGSSADLREALRLAPKSTNTSGIYSTLCLATQSLGDLSKAIEQCNKAIEIDQSNSDSYFNRGNIFLSKGEYENALNDYKRSVELNPGQNAVMNNIAGVLVMLGRHQEAIVIYSGLIEKGYDLPGTYKNRALAMAAIKDYRNASIDMGVAIKYSPGESGLYYARGSYLFSLGDIGGACKDFRSASLLGMQEISKWLRTEQGQVCDGSAQPDETSLEDFKKKVAKMSWDELLKETSISEDVNPSLDFSLRDYIESWLAKSEYADLIYIKNEDGSTTIET